MLQLQLSPPPPSSLAPVAPGSPGKWQLNYCCCRRRYALYYYWKTPGELGVSKSVECDFSLQCFDTVGWSTGRASVL